MKRAMNYVIVLLFLLTLRSSKAEAQEFINGDLWGIINGISSLPANWFSVPYNDVHCHATSAIGATPDLTDFNEPDSSNGIIGNPYSGRTFVSGVVSDGFQEGIMQVVAGFSPLTTYTINFHQAVVKQSNCLDSSGSWAVYVDTLLAGITAPTFSSAPFNSTSFVWELRSVTFVATEVSHNIEFLPLDDDSLWNDLSCLRMGIDCISISGNCNVVNTSVDDYSLEGAVTAYPNPVSDILVIESHSNELLEIMLSDVASDILIQKKFTDFISLSTEQLPSGIYFYEVRNQNGIVKRGKVTKQ